MELAPLVDRVQEMARLERLWDEVQGGHARLAVVYGRRQVGKTFLLLHLVQRIRVNAERAVMATGLSGASPRQQLEVLAGEVRRQLPDEVAFIPERFADWPSALRWLLAAAERRPLAVVLDEVPAYIDSTATWPSHVHVAWDDVRSRRQPPSLLLILTGSAVATMRNLVGGSGAMFGRADEELAVEPFDLPTAARFLPTATPAGVVEAYAACGGYPLHLRAWDPSETAERNLHRLVAEPGGVLAHAGERMLADLPDEGGHRRVLHVIGSGQHKRAAIRDKADQRVERPIELLQRAALVRIDRPLGSPDRTPGRYEVTDTYLRCWYELCWADLGLIDGGQGAQVLQRRLPRWQRHLGRVFEEQARAHAVRLAGAGRFPAAIYGRWWTTSGHQVEIDVLALRERSSVLVGEARWSDNPLGLRDLADLRRKALAVPDPVADIRFVTWSRGGAEPSALAAGLVAFRPDDMVQGEQ